MKGYCEGKSKNFSGVENNLSYSLVFSSSKNPSNHSRILAQKSFIVKNISLIFVSSY